MMHSDPSFLEQQESARRELKDFQREYRPRSQDLPADVALMIRKLHKRLFDPCLSVKTLKRRCGIQDNNASSRFRHFMGATIKEYIDCMRMKAAARLLSTSSLGIFEVSQSIGYEHPQTFYRVFRRHFQCTPADFRRRRMDQAEGP